MTIETYQKIVHEDDRDALYTLFEGCIRDAKDFDMTYRILTPQGEIRYVHSIGRVITDDQGQVRRMFGTLLDITEGKLVEESLEQERDKLSRLMQTSPVGITILDQAGQIISANPRAEDILGLDRDKITSRTYNAPDWRITDLDGGPFPDEQLPFHQVMETHQPVYGIEHGIEWPDGSRILLSINASPLLSPEGKFEGMIASVEDISERKRTEKELSQHRNHLEELVTERTRRLEEANAELQKLSRIKDEFVSNVSHELRSPITSLKMREYLLEKHPEDLTKHLAVIRRETDRLDRTIEDLLQLSRLDQQERILNKHPVDLNLFVDQLVADRSLLAKDQGLELGAEIGNEPLVVEADEGLLNQVLSVLVTNAINYTPAGGVITVSTHTTEVEGQGWAGFSVADTGPGIPAEDRARLFDRFFRGQAGRESDKKGTGLGLSLAKEIVDRHAGRIEVESSDEPDEGTTFKVWLPLNK